MRNNSNRTRVTYPDGWFVQYDYDNVNRLSAIKENGTGALAAYGYDALSRHTSTTLGNGATISSDYDLANRLYTQTHALTASDAVTFTYGYNNANQRSSITASDITYLWTPAVSNNPAYGVADTQNRYPAVGGVAQGYDLNGNLASDGVFTYGYNTENRLISATAAGKSLSFTYDPFGRRYSKVVNGVATAFVHDGMREVEEYTAGARTARHVFSADDAAVLSIKNAEYIYAHADMQGSEFALTDGTRHLQGQITYSPYGESGNLARAASFGISVLDIGEYTSVNLIG